MKYLVGIVTSRRHTDHLVEVCWLRWRVEVVRQYHGDEAHNSEQGHLTHSGPFVALWPDTQLDPMFRPWRIVRMCPCQRLSEFIDRPRSVRRLDDKGSMREGSSPGLDETRWQKDDCFA